MTAVLLTPLTGQFFDNNGNPLNGGLIYSYAAGTSTPQATYTDASGTIPAANPVVCNSAGRADIWGSGTYKFIIKDSLGNTLDTIDNVTAIFGSGDMTKAVYDPANISEQLVGLTATQSLSNKTLFQPNLVGTTTNNNSSAGSVGEFLEATTGPTSMTSIAAMNATSISLTSGDWDVWGNVLFTAAGGTTFTNVTCAINTTSATLPVSPNAGSYAAYPLNWVVGQAPSIPAGTKRISIASTTTIYLIGFSVFSGGTATATGYIAARRRR